MFIEQKQYPGFIFTGHLKPVSGTIILRTVITDPLKARAHVLEFPKKASVDGVDYPMGIDMTTIDHRLEPSEIIISENITTIEHNPFHSESIRNIKVNPANPRFTSVNGYLYDKSITTLRSCPPLLSNRYPFPFPESTTAIGPGAFINARFEKIELPPRIKSIGALVFEKSALKSIFIPAGANIDRLAFDDRYSTGNLRTIYCCDESRKPDGFHTTISRKARVIWYKRQDEDKYRAIFNGNRPSHAVNLVPLGHGINTALNFISENAGNLFRAAAVIVVLGGAIFGINNNRHNATKEETDQIIRSAQPSAQDTPQEATPSPAATTGADTYIQTGHSVTYTPEPSTPAQQEDNTLWQQLYTGQYAELERQAENQYRSLTNLGARHESDGTPKGTTGRNDPYIASQLAQFSDLQHRMRNLRNEAAQKGVIISASYWENAAVNP